MTTAVQQFIRAQGLDALASLGIKAKRHPQFPNLVLVIYDQIESPKSNPVVQTSRGHILDQSNDWAHVCRAMDRFFNEGEMPHLPQVDYSKAECATKEDGSLAHLWHYAGEWHMSTKGSPDAGGEVGDYPIKFSELFWDTWRQLGYDLPQDTSKTYIFELCTLYNRVVCRQAQSRIVLIAVRDNETGVEYHPSLWGDKYEIRKAYDLSDLSQIRDTFMELSPLDVEGYVVTQYLSDGRVLRSKVKHPGYLALAHLKEGITMKRLLDLRRNGEEGEFLACYPEYREQFSIVDDKFSALVAELEALYEQTREIEVQKDFALAIAGRPLSNCLFAVRRNGISVKKALADANLDTLYKVLRISEDSMKKKMATVG